MSIYQDRPVIDRHHLEQQISQNYHYVISSQKQDIRIDHKQSSAFYQLDKTKNSKAHTNNDRDKTKLICDRVYGHMYACKMMKPKVERRKANLCSVRANCLHVNALDQRCPQKECQQEPDSPPQVLLFVLFHIHSVLSVCISDGNDTEDL